MIVFLYPKRSIIVGPTMHKIDNLKRSFILLITGSVAIGLTLNAYSENASITTDGNQRCITSNGLPDHSTGQFPNRGNPYSISKQDIHYCFPLNPKKSNRAKKQGGSIGVALNGVTIRPGTADYWDASSPRGYSRDRSSGWNLEGIGSRDALGMDKNNAHVDNNGLYHYHGVAEALVESTSAEGTIIGYAADGFEIHYVPSEKSSYQLKTGTRPSGPKGRYDGSYNEDWKYISGSGTLDECNGGDLNGQFVYFATDTYPFFPRCLWGNASSDFGHQGRPQQEKSAMGSNHQSSNERKPQKGERRGPPAEALSACSGQSANASCSFPMGNRSIDGTCRVVRNGDLACVPSRRH